MAGTISAYMTKGGKRWRIRYRKPDGKQTDKRGFLTKRDASLFLSTIEVSKARGSYIDPTEGKRHVSEFAQAWMDGHLATLKPSSQHVMRTSWRVHVEPEWGTRQVASIRPSEISAWSGRMQAGGDDRKALGAQTVRRAMFVLSLVLERAVQDGVIDRNPAKGLRLPAKTRKPIVYLSHAQVEELAQASDKPDLIRFMAYTGLRWGEVAALRVRHVDIKQRRLTISDNVVHVAGEDKFGTPKHGETRQVIVPDFIQFALRRLIKDRPESAFVWGEDLYPIRRPHAEYSWFASAVKACMAADAKFPRVTPHDLRHTAASLAVSAGANVKAVQRMLGHASAAMTLDVYADLFDSDLDTVAKALSDARTTALAGVA